MKFENGVDTMGMDLLLDLMNFKIVRFVLTHVHTKIDAGTYEY